MDEQIEVHARLGTKTLIIFVLQKSRVLFLFVVAITVSFILLQIAPLEYSIVLYRIIGGIAVGGVVVFTVIFFTAYVTYMRYSITLTSDVLKVTKGFINEEEIGVPYRRIKEVKIERDVADQLLGTSDVIISLSGADEDESGRIQSIIVLPAIEKELASHIESEVVKRAEIEKIDVDPRSH